MIGRKYSKSLISRLEALEAKKPGALIFDITLDDGSHTRVNYTGLMAMREAPYSEGDICYTGFPDWQIVGGNNLNELDGLLSAMFGEDKTVK